MSCMQNRVKAAQYTAVECGWILSIPFHLPSFYFYVLLTTSTYH